MVTDARAPMKGQRGCVLTAPLRKRRTYWSARSSAHETRPEPRRASRGSGDLWHAPIGSRRRLPLAYPLSAGVASRARTWRRPGGRRERRSDPSAKEDDMKFGIHIGHMGGPLAEMRKLWKFADAKGFDWFSVSDHFQESPPRGGDMDCYEAIATLTAAAMDTTTHPARQRRVLRRVPEPRPARQVAHHDRPSLQRPRRLRARAPAGTTSRRRPSATRSPRSAPARTCSRSTRRSCACCWTPSSGARTSRASTSA